MTEAITIAKGLAARSGDRLNVNHEMIGQGVGPDRGGVHRRDGASRLADPLGAEHDRRCPVAPGPGLQRHLHGADRAGAGRTGGLIPLASLAAVIIYSATGLINVREMRRIIAGTRSDTVVLVLTIASTLVLRLDRAIYFGAALSVLMALRNTSRLVLSEMVLQPTAGSWKPPPTSGPAPARSSCCSSKARSTSARLTNCRLTSGSWPPRAPGHHPAAEAGPPPGHDRRRAASPSWRETCAAGAYPWCSAGCGRRSWACWSAPAWPRRSVRITSS